MAISDAEVKRMFGRDYAAQRTSGVQHQLFGHQNFNDRATAQSYLAGAVAEAVGREHIAFVTELLGADLHIGPGKLRRDPKILIRNLMRKYRQLFPDHHIYVVGFFENILREINHSGKSRARNFIADVSGAPARQKKQHERSKEAQPCAEEGAGWIDGKIDRFLADCFPQEALQRVLADMYSGSTSTAPLIEVPHAHLLIAVFDVHGRPLPFNELKCKLQQAATARYQLNVQQLYSLDSILGAAGNLALMARNAFEQAARCIRYAIKRSGNLINDRDLQFRTIVRGTAPSQGFFDVLLMGKNLVKRSRPRRIIPPTSVLGQVIAERRRMAPIVGVECPNDGEPEKIKQIENRLLGTRTPMVLKEGKARRSTNSTVYNSFYSIGKSSGTFLMRGVGSFYEQRSTMIYWLSGPIKWIRKKMGGGP